MAGTKSETAKEQRCRKRKSKAKRQATAAKKLRELLNNAAAGPVGAGEAARAEHGRDAPAPEPCGAHAAPQRAAVDAPQPEGSGAAAGTGATPRALEPRTPREPRAGDGSGACSPDLCAARAAPEHAVGFEFKTLGHGIYEYTLEREDDDGVMFSYVAKGLQHITGKDEFDRASLSSTRAELLARLLKLDHAAREAKLARAEATQSGPVGDELVFDAPAEERIVVVRYREPKHDRARSLTTGVVVGSAAGELRVETDADGDIQSYPPCDIVTQREPMDGLRLIPAHYSNLLSHLKFWPPGQPTQNGEPVVAVTVVGAGTKLVELAAKSVIEAMGLKWPDATAVAVSLDNDSQIESSTYAEHLNHIHVMGDLKNAVIALVTGVLWLSFSCSTWSTRAAARYSRSKKNAAGDVSQKKVIESIMDIQKVMSMVESALARDRNTIIVIETTDNLLKYFDPYLDFLQNTGFAKPNSYPRCPFAHKTPGPASCIRGDFREL